jgi:hypothetical protein
MRIHSRWLLAAIFAGAAVTAAGLLCVFDPATSGVFPPCPVRYLTGWYCPGCGSLRAIHQLLHGNLQAAWAMNPLAVILLPFVLYGLTSYALNELRGHDLHVSELHDPNSRWPRLPHLFLPAVWIRALCAAIILFGIARNLPFHPFDLLAPGAMLRF